MSPADLHNNNHSLTNLEPWNCRVPIIRNYANLISFLPRAGSKSGLSIGGPISIGFDFNFYVLFCSKMTFYRELFKDSGSPVHGESNDI